jgi:hypothetical protein
MKSLRGWKSIANQQEDLSSDVLRELIRNLKIKKKPSSL